MKRRLPLFEIGMLFLGLLYVSPCALALLNSFKTLPEIVRSPVAPPEAPTLENYHYIFTGIKLAAPMFNSLLMCVAVITTLIVVASMAAYSLTRRRMRTNLDHWGWTPGYFISIEDYPPTGFVLTLARIMQEIQAGNRDMDALLKMLDDDWEAGRKGSK